VLAATVTLIVGYVPTTGLDHLHLHLDHGFRLFHDHLHIGHHDHGHPHDTTRPENHDGDSGKDKDPGSAVVTIGHGAQVQPAAVQLDGPSAPVADHTAPVTAVAFDEPLHPFWHSRAPPTA